MGAGPQKAKGDAWLLKTLEENGGSMGVAELQKRSYDANIGWRTLNKAKKAIGVLSRKTPEGWEWYVGGTGTG